MGNFPAPHPGPELKMSTRTFYLRSVLHNWVFFGFGWRIGELFNRGIDGSGNWTPEGSNVGSPGFQTRELDVTIGFRRWRRDMIWNRKLYASAMETEH